MKSQLLRIRNNLIHLILSKNQMRILLMMRTIHTVNLLWTILANQINFEWFVFKLINPEYFKL